MFGRLSIAKQGLIIVILLLAVELLFVGAIAWSLQDSRAKLARERHIVAVVTGSSRIAILTHKFGTALTLDVMPKTLQEMLPEPPNIDEARNKLDAEFSKFRNLASEDEDAQALIEEQKNIVKKVVRVYEEEKEFYKVDYDLRKSHYAPDEKFRRSDLSEKYDRLMARYKSIGQSAPAETSRAIATLKWMILSGLIFNLLGALGFVYFFTNRVSRRIKSLTNNMHRFQNKEPLSITRSKARDEIGRLDHLFNEMVNSISQAKTHEKALVDGAFDVICTIDAEGNFIEMNAACQHQWGYKPETVLEMNISDIVMDSDIDEVLQHLKNVKSKNTAVSFDAGIKCSDERKIDTQWSCYWSPKLKASFCFIRDVSDLNKMDSMLKAREEQIRTLMRNLPIGLFVLDEKGCIKSANNKMEFLMKCDRGSLLGKEAGQVFESHSLSQTSVLAQAREESPLRCFLTKLDGKELAVEVTVNDLISPNVVDTLVVVEDVQERLRLEKIKKDFVDLLRESLRTPLSDVREIAVNAEPEIVKLHKVKVDRIVSNADRLLRLIDELLNIETLGPGKLVGKLKSVSISEVLEVAVDALRDYSTRQCVSIKLHPEDGTVMADYDRLVQVVINLLSNAIKFSPKDGTVVVSSAVIDDSLEVSIIDSGRGVPEEKREAIFKPYVQTSAGDSQKGTGLGLPICKTIIEAHNGSIGVKAHDTAGSVFWFRIPRGQTENSQ